ncbi:universal stress protein [Pseudonocardia halophobica]|uniref:Universal stress protein n=1 Tax=Pseudonocardia halophobica TaxID=29401 RepID=A0A9W6KZ98_9PSEU|nr:universal stress protein [Pseudonocardia halophobica]GLL10711.1 universal stress protein [Pseudonocardia halophobica]
MTGSPERTAGGPVVVGVDESDSARDAVRWAAAEAARRGAPLRLVAAFAPIPAGHVGNPGLGTSYRRVMTEAARGVLTSAAELAAQVAPGVATEAELRTGFPVPVLLDESDRAVLTVVGSRGLGGFTGLLVGSVAVALAARGGSPVAVVRGDPGEGAEGDRPVVVGVDGSPTGESALALAYEEAALRSAPLVAVHTWLDDMLEPALAPMIDWAALETEESALLAQRLAGWSEKYPDVEVRRLVVRDRPARALVAESAGAALVVVGSRGRGGAAGLLLGSVSHALLQHAHCPVLVVRPDGGGSG